MAKTKTIPWDSAAHLKTDEDIANYLEAVFEDGDPALIAHALGVIARVLSLLLIASAASAQSGLTGQWSGTYTYSGRTCVSTIQSRRAPARLLSCMMIRWSCGFAAENSTK